MGIMAGTYMVYSIILRNNRMKRTVVLIFYIFVVLSCKDQTECGSNAEIDICERVKKKIEHIKVDLKANALMHSGYNYGTDTCGKVIFIRLNTLYSFPREFYEFRNLNELVILEGNLPDWRRFKTRNLTSLTTHFIDKVMIKDSLFKNLKYLCVEYAKDVSIDKNIHIEEIHMKQANLDLRSKIFHKTKKLSLRGNSKVYAACIQDLIDFDFFPDLEEFEMNSGGRFEDYFKECDSLEAVSYLKNVLKKYKKIKKIAYNRIVVESPHWRKHISE